MAYKAYKAAKGAPQGRDAKRMMQKMGMKIDEIDGVTEVLIRTPTREIIIEEPVVTSVVVQGQRMYQITGGSAHERTPSAEAAQPEVPEEDVNLVVTQTGKTVDEAKAALKESGGDLAEAILRLKQKNPA
ncbi:MAG: nascent polypeptide-associated complex protein [Candidatus Bathyarchaeia archaeon]|jgi:nascent polypeptide-associated complex subunit alpha